MQSPAAAGTGRYPRSASWPLLNGIDKSMMEGKNPAG
jgi:hypothetical protein